MTNNSSLNSIAFSIALAMICLSLGCEQQRYSPSAWAPATGGNGTLPGVGQLGDVSTGAASSLPSRTGTLPGRSGMGTLPGRNVSSLPWRAGSQTLPNRAGTLPSRAGTLPNRAGTLPSRQQIVVTRSRKMDKPALPSLAGKPVWDVREKREMGRVPGKPGLYMGESEGIIGFPSSNVQRGSGSTLPSRGANTLPARARKSNWSTLPGRK